MASPAWSQQAMLEPPDNHYFVNQGSWGQNYPDQWALKRIGLDTTAPIPPGGLSNAMPSRSWYAVIDTGLDWNHQDIDQDSLWHNPKEIPGNGIDDDHNGYIDDTIGWDFFDNDNKPWDYDGHGTMTAGIIAASWKDKDGMAGVNPFARIMVVKAINNFGHSRASLYFSQAIAYAVDNGARVINLSVGGKEVTKVEQAAIDYAYAKGAVIVVASGNEGVDVSNYGIAGSDKVITVGFDGLR